MAHKHTAFLFLFLFRLVRLFFTLCHSLASILHPARVAACASAPASAQATCTISSEEALVLCEQPTTLVLAADGSARWFEEFTVIPYMYEERHVRAMSQERCAAINTLVAFERPDVLRRVLASRLLPHVTRAIVWNTEQMSRPGKIDAFCVAWRAIRAPAPVRLAVWDYSAWNANKLQAALGLDVTVCPTASAADVAALRELCRVTPKTHDFACVGSPSPARKRAVTRLRQNGFTVDDVHAWGRARDVRIAGAKALLNLHYDRSYSVFEAVRCSRWLRAGMAVVSEPCSDADGCTAAGATIVDFSKWQARSMLLQSTVA
jgi:hypothetical protein